MRPWSKRKLAGVLLLVGLVVAVGFGALLFHSMGTAGQAIVAFVEQTVTRMETPVAAFLEADVQVRKDLSGRITISGPAVPGIRIGDDWKLISDHAIASYLSNKQDRRQALRQLIQDAHSSGELALELATVVCPETSVKEALERSAGKPVLVVSERGLLGIATPFDLL